MCRLLRVDIQQWMAGQVENVFQTRLGVADPPMVDYVIALLVRFVRMDAIFRLRTLSGARIPDVVAMLVEADQRIGEAKREAHRHIGDFTLFWTGVYPEALGKRSRRDSLTAYQECGKHCYRQASLISVHSDTGPEPELLERLSAEFELCAFGLNEVRRSWREAAA